MPQDARQTAVRPRPGAAPGDLELVRALVNSRDLDEGTDEFTTVAGLAGWLERHGLLAAGPQAPVTRADLDQAVALREALRGVLRAHAGAAGGAGRYPADDTSGAAGTDGAERAASGPAGDLRRIAAGLATRLDVSEDGALVPVPAGSGVPGALARILLIAAAAATAGTWPRLKACAADDCQWAFYDRSPTRTGCWCSMRLCGARAKSRAYRRRAAGRAG